MGTVTVLLHLNFNSKEQTLTLMAPEEKKEGGYETSDALSPSLWGLCFLLWQCTAARTQVPTLRHRSHWGRHSPSRQGDGEGDWVCRNLHLKEDSDTHGVAGL